MASLSLSSHEPLRGYPSSLIAHQLRLRRSLTGGLPLLDFSQPLLHLLHAFGMLVLEIFLLSQVSGEVEQEGRGIEWSRLANALETTRALP